MAGEPNGDELLVERWRTTSVFFRERFMVPLIGRAFDAVEARPIQACCKIEAACVRRAFEEAMLRHFLQREPNMGPWLRTTRHQKQRYDSYVAHRLH
jgi:hypothetical protein